MGSEMVLCARMVLKKRLAPRVVAWCMVFLFNVTVNAAFRERAYSGFVSPEEIDFEICCMISIAQGYQSPQAPLTPSFAQSFHAVAMRNEIIHEVLRIRSLSPDALNARVAHDGSTQLIVASYQGRVALVKQFLLCHADASLCDYAGHNACDKACGALMENDRRRHGNVVQPITINLKAIICKTLNDYGCRSTSFHS